MPLSQLVLTPAQFVAKWTERFAYNQWEDIDDATFREFTTDLAATFGTPAVNVPVYLDGSDYTVGYLVRYSLAGGSEAFYYALLDGKLPAPTGQATDANWKVVPGPVPATQLYQAITLAEAQGMDVVPGRRYGISGKWNASATDQLVFLDGLTYAFRRRGTLVAGDGSQQEVAVDVAAGTYAPVAAGGGGGSTNSVQLTNTGSSPYVDVLLEQPTAQLASSIGLANYAGLQAQVINPLTNAPFATESANLDDVQASLSAAWATGVSRLLLRCLVLPLRNGLVAHARLLFTQPATSWVQSLAPHASAFRLFGNAFALQAVEWTHANNMQVNGSSIFNNGAANAGTGSPQAAIQAGGGTGLLMAFEFTHNRNYQYDLVGLTDSLNPSDASFSAAFFITQASTWSAYSGSTTLASGSLSNSNWRFRIEVYDDHVNWLLDGSVVYTLVGSLMADQLWPGAKLGSNSGITSCLAGGQVTSPR